jgi:hypothetical protein
MQRTTPRRDEAHHMPELDRLTTTYALLVLALLVLNVAGYGLIAATI